MKKPVVLPFAPLPAALLLTTCVWGILAAWRGVHAADTPERPSVILATTTSTRDSGLLDELLPIFEKETGYFVKPIAVGSGQAMAMGRRGEADVLLVHSPDAERKFVADAFGVNRRRVMHNDFIIVGPTNDPAGIAGSTTVSGALARVVESKAVFISRGDNSGTHALEMKLWQEAGIHPEDVKSYHQTGQGMGQTLAVASEKRAYTLTDRGTWLALRKRLDLALLFEGHTSLLNVYHVIEVNPAKWPKVNAAGAKAFTDFMLSARTQDMIARFGVDTFGGPLFTADADGVDEDKTDKRGTEPAPK